MRNTRPLYPKDRHQLGPTKKISVGTYKLIDNTDARQYEFKINGLIPKIQYIRAKDRIYLTHTEVPDALKGKGIGSLLVHAALEDIKAQGATLVPLCPFVAGYLKEHPAWKKLLMNGINIG